MGKPCAPLCIYHMTTPIPQRPGDSSAENLFHLEPNGHGFESLAQQEGFKFWWASDMARLMGYESLDAFRKPINKAMIACDALGVPLVENFVQERRVVDGHEQLDFRLSRFACYLAAMNGNVNNPRVLMTGTPQNVRAAARQAAVDGVNILAPECAVPLTTPTENLRAIAETAKEFA